ncbi:piezo-type mechanosensitive ion channel component isoform X4 [Anopheles stephensi]|uniref:piezo-type mechanosensitive ion channel component isoform X4 n=1 Tax=Anopheles stephensi TaxID=30069 RepID=UPI001658B876|nr:piezo-type mechanosensitive ion channel component isoform X4 [Anopheles stephensi]
MANYFLCLVVQRLVLPLILATCVLMRPVGLAIPYLIFLLAIPYVPIANKKTIMGTTGTFIKLLTLYAILYLAITVTFQIVLISFPGSSVVPCSLGEIVLRHIGIVSFNQLGAWMVVYWLAPEVILISCVFVVHLALRKLTGVIVPRGQRRRRAGDDANSTTAQDDTEQGNGSVQESQATGDPAESEPQTSLISPERLPFFTKLGVLLSMCMLCVVGIIQPSALSGVYFIVFLGAASWWACYKKLDRAFGIVLKITLVFLVIHIVLFLAYQNPWPQEVLYFNDTTARVLGLKPILNSSCDLANGTDIRNVYFNSDYDTDVYLNPIFLLLCYYTVTMTSSLLLRTRSDMAKDRKRMDLSSQLENGIRLQNQISFRMQRKNILRKTLTSDRWRGAARKVKLMRRGTHRIRDASANDGKEGGAQTDQIALETLARNKTISEEEEPSSFFEQGLLAIRNVASYIYKNSYIFTNVIMMVWSIMYHSWLTFLLLLWANIIWILPNHRRNMLMTSPLLVIYAEFLLLAQFIYGMNLTEAELPTVIEGSGINLEEVGFVRRTEYPCVPLLVKSLFTTMFWISMRQLIQEKQTERRESMIANMAAPLQVPVGAATTAATGPPSVTDQPPKKKSSAVVDKMAKFLRSLMIKFWIWVVALTLFLSAIIGNRMTMFRILYMALFLFFVLTFQFSFRVWRKVMFTFWLFVIMYSMGILILVYLHQFEQFPRYWEAIGISKELQEDLGLEIFKTGQLFLHLVNPTLVVIITVIQLHYCHERFLIISEIPTVQTEDHSDDEDKQEPVTAPATDGPSYGTFANPETAVIDDANEPVGQSATVAAEGQATTSPAKTSPNAQTNVDEDDDEQSEKIEDFRFRKLSRQEITGFARKAWKMLLDLLELTWLFFEIHMLKIVLIVAFSLSVNSVNLLHIVYVVLSVFTVKTHTTGKDSLMYIQVIRITRIMSLFSAIMLLATMVYQVKYIKVEWFVSECPNIDANTTRMDMNNLKWAGMRKTADVETLSDLLRPYLVYILIVTVHTVTILRQTIHRIRLGQSPKTPSLMFPRIVRADADKDIPRMVQYLFNYGYYKFGVEISLVSLIVVIGNRMDVLSIFYAIWLAAMFHMTRASLQRLWKPLTWFIVVVIPIQYLLFIGLPPFACVNYPWFIAQLDHFRIWAMLPENTTEFRSFANKMVSDFVLLMFLCRQTVVFRLETNPPRGFGGGSNQSVLEDFKKLDEGNLQNPTPDFITKVRNWLDMAKRTLFLVSFWFTLAVVFLTGSSRVNLFSIGYLIGAFFFLWQGTDFYLHSIEYILKRWNILICYNVFVIGAKALLQLFGCLFLENLVNNNCWVMQLLGMNCLSSALPPLPPGTVDPGEQCNIPDPSDAGLFWDGMCFAFLLLQRRLFSSHYFCHIINESKASKYLASRGAELIEELRIKESAQEAERERQILEKIKAKMDRIKATQQKILEAVQDPATHAIGYHTPIEDEIAANSMFIEGEGLSEMPSDNGGLTVGRGSYQTQVPSPSSALMTVSLDAYLDPQRMSFDSPNDLMARVCSPDDTFPVFSPPPFEKEQPPFVATSTNNTLMPPTKTALQTRQHRRQSSLNAVSWPANNELTVSPKAQHRTIPTGNSYVPPEEPANGRDNDQSQQPSQSPRSPRSPRSATFAPNQPRHRRLSSMGSGSGVPDELTGADAIGARRRSSFLVSLFVDEDTTRYDEVTTTANGGPTSRRRSRSRSFWGPVGEAGLRDSIRSARSRSPVSHHEYTVDHRSSLKRKISEHRPTAIRSGDYYMFEEVEQEFELDLMEPHEYEDDLEEKSQKDQRLRHRLTLGRLAAQLRRQRQQEVYELAYGTRTDNDDTNAVDQPPTLASSDLPPEDQPSAPLRRRLSSPVVLRRAQPATLGATDGGGGGGTDDYTVPAERSAISEPLPHHSAHSGTRLRKPTALDAPDAQAAGTSRELHAQQSLTDEEARLLSDEEDEVEGRKEAAPEEKKSKFSLSGLALIPAFLAGAVGSLTLRLHRASRNYRYVMRVLTREKQVLKETPGFGVGIRDKDGVWTHCVSRTASSTSPQPEGSAHSGTAQSGSSSSSLLSRPGSLASISRFNSSNVNDPTDYERDYAEAEQPPSAVPSSPAVTFTVSEVRADTSVTESEARPNTIRDLQEYCTERQPPGDEGLHTVSGLGAALAMISRKDPLREERSNSLLPEILISAPSAERGLDEDGIPYRYYSNDTLDSKTDGSSTDAVKRTLDEVSSEEDFTSRKHSVLFELFQAAWYAIMSHTDFICYFVVFLNQVNSASLLSLPLPLMVTLWGTLTFPRPAQTFWTMLIAYTQMVVLVKCIGQFEMFWWNQTPIPSNQPFHVARLFGIERKDGYATYDLILLLMLYCHRFILKSLGLWKSDPSDEPALAEGLYQVDPNDERAKALMAMAEENERKRETLEIRPPDELTGLSMVKINEKDGTIVEEPTSQNDGNVLCVTIHSEPTKKYFPQIAKEAFVRYSAALSAFFKQLLDRTSRKTTDVYGYMFLCDFINFFVILFGFSSFGTQDGDGGVLSYFEENRVPVTFLVMLLIQFFLIVVDRALYLRKHITGKIVFQFILIIGLHVWMFFVLPATTERSFNATTPPVLYYMIKCFYLLFSAYQIRCGYPARILGNFLTKGFTMANFSGFKLFMTVPFLFELRTLMDWIWTDTSMTLFDWLKMEDIFSNVYQLKCMRQLEEDLPAPRGQKKGSMVKYLMGGGMMLGIIFLIWFPLALFAFSNAVGQPNIPHDVSVELRIGTYEPVYAMSAQNNSIYGLTPNNWSNFTTPFMERAAQTFLSNYEPADVAAVQLGISSTSIWNISPPDRNRLLNDLINNVTLTCRFRYTISRMTNSKENPGVISEERTYQLEDGPARQALINSLTRKKDEDMALLMNIMPKFLRVQNSGSIRPVHQLVKTADGDEADENYRNMQLRQLYMDDKSNVSWWEATEDCTDTLYEKYFSRLPFADCTNYLVIYMFNDKIFPSTISSIAAGGIIGIYSTMILVFSRMLRTSIFSGASSKIMFEDLPYVDRVLQLCLDIYLVRESSEFTLEEDLFAKLLFLYRSPETMIKWTRPKNEGGGDDETDTMTEQEASRPKQE